MKVHPQVFRTLKAVERLRKQRQPHILQITFGPGGIQRTFLDGKPFQLDPKITVDEDEEED